MNDVIGNVGKSVTVGIGITLGDGLATGTWVLVTVVETGSAVLQPMQNNNKTKKQVLHECSPHDVFHCASIDPDSLKRKNFFPN